MWPVAERTTQLNISISGMTCDHCAEAIEHALRELPGLSACRVRVGNADVTLDELVTGRDSVFTAIRQAGAFDISGFSVSN